MSLFTVLKYIFTPKENIESIKDLLSQSSILDSMSWGSTSPLSEHYSDLKDTVSNAIPQMNDVYDDMGTNPLFDPLSPFNLNKPLDDLKEQVDKIILDTIEDNDRLLRKDLEDMSHTGFEDLSTDLSDPLNYDNHFPDNDSFGGGFNDW